MRPLLGDTVDTAAADDDEDAVVGTVLTTRAPPPTPVAPPWVRGGDLAEDGDVTPLPAVCFFRAVEFRGYCCCRISQRQPVRDKN